MKLLVTVLFLFTFSCYSLLGDNWVSNQNSHSSSLTTIDLNNSVGCCISTTTKIEDVHCSEDGDDSEDSCKNTCCKDYCSCIKVLKTPYLQISQQNFSPISIIESYVDLYIFSIQHYTPNIFKPPKHIA